LSADPDPKRQEVHVRFDAGDYAVLRAEAERQGRSVSNLVRFMLQREIERIRK
jgi:hypothetical protein